MEAVPRLPMLSFPVKLTTKPVDFGECLKRYIQLHYHEDPESYNNEITELESLRRSAVNASTDFIGCSSLKKYYCQLHYLISRFPPEELGSKLQNSAFDQSVSESGDINYEMNNILYNIATLHTILGAADARTSPDGMKISCTHFQCASWAFQVLSQNSKGEGDFNPLLITFMTHLALSQAQECILEKSMTDNRKPNIIAKVAMQVVDYLRLTLKNLESFRKSSTSAVSLVWQRHCDFKIAYYLAVTYYHQGLQSEEQQKMGERIAFYQASVEKLEEALKVSKTMEKAKVIGEALTFANDVIRGKLTGAQKENEFVYHEKIPPFSSLPEVKGASLVKGISFSFTDPEVAGPDIFSRLVPIEAHQASSLYSEEKAKLLRRITGEIQEKDEELEMYLASMQLDSFAFEENYDNLPQELVDACADLNSRDAFKGLQEIIDNISGYYNDLERKIKETEELIKEEESSEKEFCLVIGTKRAPNQILTEQKREIIKYKEAHEAALASNQALQNAIAQHKENLILLSKPLNLLMESLPSVAGVESEADKATRMEVQRLLGKVHEMQMQRSEFENKLRSDLQNDDITKQLVLNHEDPEAFFKEELSKHNHMVSILEQNMSAQSNILQALSESNAAYGAMRRTINQVKSQRAGSISFLLASYNAFINILQKAEEAKEFYTKLETQVNKVNSRVKSFHDVQEEERKAKLVANVKKLGGNIKLDL
ncbi:Tyrosine-protein phosphatase non-receptor type 23 [Armadillidium nasatum]|uniref:Tyrosine-protein phosphatase non-receptor type 23 n=1 Tax=Armadillidium nasatum TaxID=96803 RepID=A0A5N5SQ66_9CRUS|nr:Tyrosine-protein phosphatase non-receptor type 23 [Armadillidium nasatum]